MHRLSVLSVLQFTKKHVLQYIHLADRIKRHGPEMFYHDKTIVNLFYEPSTRTSCSFQYAAIQLGCKVINLSEKASSAEKGESLEDTIKTLSYYGDAIVLRHPEKGSSQRAALVSRVPVLNAGDGDGEHPTQALLDIYTIHYELANRGIKLDCETRPPVVVTLLGDLKHSRTIHSLVHMLTLFPNITFVYVNPPSLVMPSAIVEKVSALAYEQIDSLSLEEALKITDVLYVTRIQKERFKDPLEYQTIHRTKVCITKAEMTQAKDSMILMHPLPRLDEISTEVDSDPRAVYFKQVENGIYMRMAILDTLFR